MVRKTTLAMNGTLKWGWILAIGMAGSAALEGTLQIAMLLAFLIIFVAEVILEIDINTITFARTRLGGMIPTKRQEDAGWDIYACFDEDYIAIAPGETKMIGTGICSSFSRKYVAILKERGSTGTKGIGQRSGCIDSGFRNEWMVPITNHNKSKWLYISKLTESELKEKITAKTKIDGAIIYPYEKAICQALFVEVPELHITEVTHDKILKKESERGEGMLGSSGK